jgi:non-specific serine/threonine protein kinase
MVKWSERYSPEYPIASAIVTQRFQRGHVSPVWPSTEIDTSIATLKEHLRTKKMLLIFDNCEHLIEDVARLSEAILDSCSDLRIVATSREALNVDGELTWRVRTLSVPDPGYPLMLGNLAGYESVRLFVERARYRQPAFDLTSENAGPVTEICRSLDGIPLAIELAAARVGALSVRQIVARLENSLKLLTGSRTVPRRQQTLEGALDWSLDLLSVEERVLFGRLSVFVGGFTLEAAEAVGTGEAFDADGVLELLLSLVDKSLVVAWTRRDNDTRFRMLEPVRQYGRERLEESGGAEQVLERDARYYLALAERAEPELKGPRQEAWFERLETERGNLRTALSWALIPADVQPEERAELGLRLTVTLWLFWNVHGLGSERRWLETLLEDSGARSAARAKALDGAGWAAVGRGEYERAITMFEESLASFGELGDKSGAASSLAYLGMAVLRQGDSERVKALRDEAEALRWEPLDRRAISQLLSFLGAATWYEGDHHRAVALFEENLALSRELGDARGIAQTIGSLGIMAMGQGDPERAEALLKEALRPFWELKDKPGMAFSLLGLGGAASFQGQAARAARLWGAAEALRETIGLLISVQTSKPRIPAA